MSGRLEICWSLCPRPVPTRMQRVHITRGCMLPEDAHYLRMHITWPWRNTRCHIPPVSLGHGEGTPRDTVVGKEEQTGLGIWVPSACGGCAGAPCRMGTSSSVPRAVIRIYRPHHSSHPQFWRQNAKNNMRVSIQFHPLKG